MEQLFTNSVDLASEYWWVVFWLIFCSSYIFSFLKEAFSSTEKNMLKEKLEVVEAEHSALLTKYARLVALINLKGGMSFLDGGGSQFSLGEIKNLVKLCHPDKHGGSILAKDMTAKLLALR